MHYPTSRFDSLFKSVVWLILLGCLSFSIVRNIRGLEAGYPGVSLEWQILIAFTVTMASFALTGSSILTSFRASQNLRLALFATGILFSVVSFWLSFGGAQEDNKAKHHLNAIRDPEIKKLEADIQDVIDRQSAYGITGSTRRSLLAREKELRAELRDVRARIRNRAENERRKAERTAGKMDVLALMMFCALPEVGLITFTMQLVLMSGGSVFSQSEEFVYESAPRVQPQVQRQPIMQPTPQLTTHQTPQPEPVQAPQPQIPVARASQNGKVPEHETIQPEQSKWDPFG